MTDKEYINPYKIFNGVWLPIGLLERTELSQGAKLCYALLCKYAGENGICYPSQETIAKDIGIKKRQAIRYIRELINNKVIKVEKLGKKQTNRYWFLMHAWLEDSLIKSIKCSALKHTSRGVINDTSRGVINDTSRGVINDTSRGVINDTSIVRESFKENHNTKDLLSENKFSDAQTLNSSSKSKRIKPKIDYQIQITAELQKFGVLKNLTENFIAIAASRNKTGAISESRCLSLLCQLSAVLTATGDEVLFKEALLEVIAKGVDNINYLKKVIESQTQKKTRKEANDDARFSFLKGHQKTGGGVQTSIAEPKHP